MENKFENTPEFEKDIIEFEQDFFVGNNFTTVFSPGVVYANGKSCEVRVYWDTGSSISSISYSAAKNLNVEIKSNEREKLCTANGEVGLSTCQADFVVSTPCNDYSFKSIRATLAVHITKEDAPCVLLLGMDYLSKGTFMVSRTGNRGLKLRFTSIPCFIKPL